MKTLGRNLQQILLLMIALAPGLVPGLVAAQTNPSPTTPSSTQYTEEELNRWFESDELALPNSAAHVNDGDLNFLTQAPKKAVHYHSNRLVVSEESLRSGWVRMDQCHENLDKVAHTQILYKKGRVKDLSITLSESIASSWVEDNRVLLNDIGAGAKLCTTAWVKAMKRDGNGYYIENGPFMRKFLDGYYPMRVSMDIDFSEAPIQLVSNFPDTQTGFNVVRQDGRVYFDALFEGRLKTRFEFRPRS